jgi:hypothetical protein
LSARLGHHLYRKPGPRGQRLDQSGPFALRHF